MHVEESEMLGRLHPRLLNASVAPLMDRQQRLNNEDGWLVLLRWQSSTLQLRLQSLLSSGSSSRTYHFFAWRWR